jgi:hypothetical protein
MVVHFMRRVGSAVGIGCSSHIGGRNYLFDENWDKVTCLECLVHRFEPAAEANRSDKVKVDITDRLDAALLMLDDAIAEVKRLRACSCPNFNTEVCRLCDQHSCSSINQGVAL